MLIKFTPFSFSSKILDQYFLWFNQKKFQGVLYQGTPKSKEEVKAWIIACSQDSKRRYFLMFRDNLLIGHIGLRNINFKLKHAEVGVFFADWRFRRGWVIKESVKFIIKEAKKLKLKLLTADFKDENQPQMKAFFKIGFIQNPKAPHYLTCQL